MRSGLFASLAVLLELGAALGRTGPMEMLHKKRAAEQRLKARDVDLTTLYPAHNLSVPIDHFHNSSMYEPHSNGMFSLRYWFDATYYKKGGPVIVLESGETSGEGRLPYLQKGIVYQLAKATGGLGVILEHRYYGTSFPTPDASTENLRFLTTEQALADAAYFAQHVKFEGVDEDLTAPKTPWIAYGGSYPGAFVAFLRTLYPGLFWGSISSSGVTKAIYDYWEYFEPIRMFGPQPCIGISQHLTAIVDGILIGKKNTHWVQDLKAAFGMPNVTSVTDFAEALADGVYGWQSTNWDPAVTSDSFYEYCGNVSSTSLEWPKLESKRSKVKSVITAAGFEPTKDDTNRMLNWIGWMDENYLSGCSPDQDACFGSQGDTYYGDLYNDTSFAAAENWKSWSYQYCTQWGFLQTGNVPADQLPLISRTVDIPYTSTVCRKAFNIHKPADVEAINRWGGFEINYPRLAIIDGQADPWRPATPHADAAPKRDSTLCKPFHEIPGAVHHWDENGLFPNETSATLPPQTIVDTQSLEHHFVMDWMRQWRQSKGEAQNKCVGRRSHEKYD